MKDDTNVHAVVLRAAGDRGFCAGLDTKKSYGQPDDVWNHEDPGELLSPKWQKVWKPVVCAVHGICTAGAFYFLNESDIVICSDDATFFDSHVTYGFVSALEPVGLMRKIGLGETLRMALMGNDERVTAETALRIGLVTEVVERSGCGTGPTRSPPASPANPPRRPRARYEPSGSRSTGRTGRPWSRGFSTRGSGTRSAWPRWPSAARRARAEVALMGERRPSAEMDFRGRTSRPDTKAGAAPAQPHRVRRVPRA